MAEAHDVTELLHRWQAGDQEALPKIVERVFDDLRKVARNHLRRERAGHTLEPSALVNEAYLKLVDQERADWQNRSQFFAVCSRLMRRVLVDYARARHARKREALLLSLHDWHAVAQPIPVDVLALDEALARLEASFPREAQVVELRYFCGMTLEETAACLKLAPATVKRDWAFARAWLLRQLDRAAPHPTGG